MVTSIKIPSTLTVKELVVLAELAHERAKRDAVFVEIGSWKGCSSAVLAHKVKKEGGHLFCVDHWKGSEGTKLINEASNGDMYEVFESNMRALELWDYITPMKMDSIKASEEFEDGSIDFLFIDGDHRYVQFMKDLEVWMPKVKGMACGHDAEFYLTQLESAISHYLAEHLTEDYLYGYHPGVIVGLYDYFHDAHSLVEDTSIWVKEVA